MSKNSINSFIKFLIIFICYLSYSKLFEVLFSLVGLSGLLINFISDLLFSVLIVFLYKNNIKKDFVNLKSNYNLKKILKIVIKYLLIIFGIGIIFGFINSVINSNEIMLITENTLQVNMLFNSSLLYSLFKALIFGVIIEEIVFREAIEEVISNKKIFVVVSSLIYASMNIIFGSLESNLLWLNFLQYFAFYFVLSLSYVKNDNNIFIPIVIKFIYNLIPTVITIVLMVIG